MEFEINLLHLPESDYRYIGMCQNARPTSTEENLGTPELHIRM